MKGEVVEQTSSTMTAEVRASRLFWKYYTEVSREENEGHVEEFSEELTSHLQRPMTGFPCNRGLVSLHWFGMLLLAEAKLICELKETSRTLY